MTDFAKTPQAAQNRLWKAKRIAEWCWHNGVTSEAIDYAADAEWAKLCKLAVKRPASDQTRRLVEALLVHKEAWAAAFPHDPDAKREPMYPGLAAALKAKAGS